VFFWADEPEALMFPDRPSLFEPESLHPARVSARAAAAPAAAVVRRTFKVVLPVDRRAM
jgi:hypothetical protein